MAVNPEQSPTVIRLLPGGGGGDKNKDDSAPYTIRGNNHTYIHIQLGKFFTSQKANAKMGE